MPLVVTTKYGCDRIDFLKMFSVCFNSGIEAKEFSKIYAVDMEQPRIKAPELKSVLSPLIVAHFLSIVKEIVKRGLKKDYVQREDNLKKVKGRIAIFRNERMNIQKERYDKVFCQYQEYSEDTVENRLIKKALLFSQQILQVAGLSPSLLPLQHTVHECLSAFANVNDQIEVWEVKAIKHHKIFKEYDDAIKLAQMILHRYDYNITNITTAEEEECPVFWIDMAMLYEHYVLGLLREAYGSLIHYQERGHTGYPDFVCYSPQVVLDTKYIPRFYQGSIDTYIVRQLSGYSRDKWIFPTQPDANIPCVIISPIEGDEENPFKNKPLEDFLQKEDRHLWNFHRIAVPLPMLNEN
ncbi:5-methylcytosine restriction system specificity protein McrC [Bacteroides xylanisolvens]|uniref:5-methylcytosine restriction system specificity protein McrC n=2 Tax=Bacteroides TaxID=816 RepID=UPI003AB8E457